MLYGTIMNYMNYHYQAEALVQVACMEPWTQKPISLAWLSMKNSFSFVIYMKLEEFLYKGGHCKCLLQGFSVDIRGTIISHQHFEDDMMFYFAQTKRTQVMNNCTKT